MDKSCQTCRYFNNTKLGCTHQDWNKCIKRDEDGYIINYLYYTPIRVKDKK